MSGGAAAQQQWPELRDRIDFQALPHASYARRIMERCPQKIGLKPGLDSHYRRVLSKYDAIRGTDPMRWKRYEGMAIKRARSHSCGQFAAMMSSPERSPNLFLQAR
jgi:hypothetical protein